MIRFWCGCVNLRPIYTKPEKLVARLVIITLVIPRSRNQFFGVLCKYVGL
jgi:hypothetical protein